MSFFYGVVTLGIYFFWYNWAVFQEMDQKTGKKHHGGIYLVGLAILLASVPIGLWKGKQSDWNADELGSDLLLFGLALGAQLAWAVYLWLELRQFESPLDEQGYAQPLPRIFLPAIIVIPVFLGLFTQSAWVDFIFTILMVWCFFLVHSATSKFWLHQSNIGPPTSGSIA